MEKVLMYCLLLEIFQKLLLDPSYSSNEYATKASLISHTQYFSRDI